MGNNGFWDGFEIKTGFWGTVLGWCWDGFRGKTGFGDGVRLFLGWFQAGIQRMEKHGRLFNIQGTRFGCFEWDNYGKSFERIPIIEKKHPYYV